jgi:hypothetical protein
MVNEGTGYIVANGGFFASDILIIYSRFDQFRTGCRGTVWNDYLEKNSKE